MYKIISHTADIGLELEAPDLVSLFKEAAKGWKALVFEDAEIYPQEKKAVTLAAASPEELLVNWLSELNYYLTVHYWVYAETVELRVESNSETWRLQANIRGEPFDEDRHYIYFDIKAVTFHQLKIERRDGKMKVRIFFDI